VIDEVAGDQRGADTLAAAHTPFTAMRMPVFFHFAITMASPTG
jgi:hypothetical protein